MVHLPPWPITKVCKQFAGIPSSDKRIDASDDLTPRQVALMEGLNNFLNLYTNHTGEKNCSASQDVTLHQTELGWNSLTCHDLAMPVFDGPGSIFPAHSLA